MTSPSLNKELAPCPFCGSHSLDPAKQGKRYVSCNDCGCFGPGPEQKGILGAMTQWAIAEAEINDGWNRRASTPSALPVTQCDDACFFYGTDQTCEVCDPAIVGTPSKEGAAITSEKSTEVKESSDGPSIYIDDKGALQSRMSREQTLAVLGPLVDHMRLHAEGAAQVEAAPIRKRLIDLAAGVRAGYVSDRNLLAQRVEAIARDCATPPASPAEGGGGPTTDHEIADAFDCARAAILRPTSLAATAHCLDVLRSRVEAAIQSQGAKP